MNNYRKGKLTIIIATPILYMILGIGLLLFPDTVLEYLCPVLVIVAAVFGVIEIYSYLMRPANENFQSNGFASGVILLVLAVMIFAQKEWFMEQMVLLLGFLITLNGVRELQNWVDIVRLKVNNAWITAGVALLSLVLGVAVMTDAAPIANIRLTVAAVGLLFSGLADHITTIIAYVKGRAVTDVKASSELTAGAETVSGERAAGPLRSEAASDEQPDAAADGSGTSDEKELSRQGTE